MITALDGAILAVNEAFSSITGYPAHEVIGKNPRLLQSGRQTPAFYRAMWDAITRDGYWHGEAWNRRKDGSVFAERLTISMVPDAHGRPQHYIAVFADITSADAQRQLLEQRGNFDALTGLPNRHLLGERLRRAIAHAGQYQHQVAVAFIDLDGFKAVNDTFGHAAGDELLVTMADRLQRVLRRSDTLARFGGDEFVACLPDIQDEAMLASLVERMLVAVRVPLLLSSTLTPDHPSVTLSASVGLALYPRDGGSAADLLLRADAAMYAAKRAGRDCFRCAAPTARAGAPIDDPTE